jgi:hypothetical protein
MFMYITLKKEGIALRIQTAGNILRKLLKSPSPEIGRCVSCGKSMQIGHKIVTVELLGSLCPVFDRPEVGA